MSATALYKALLEAKVSEETAEKAVEAVEELAVAGDCATKGDIAELEVRMVKWFLTTIITTSIATSGLTIAVVGLMIRFL